jgi:hypothetical protein
MKMIMGGNGKRRDGCDPSLKVRKIRIQLKGLRKKVYKKLSVTITRISRKNLTEIKQVITKYI